MCSIRAILWHRYFWKCFFIYYFILMGITVSALRESAAKGYELSIYANTPAIAWLFIGTSIVAGLLLLVSQAFSADRSDQWKTVLGFLLISFSTIFLLLLPPLRGYFLYWSSDPTAQLAWTKEVIITKRLEATDFYPPLHIVMAQLALIGKIDLVSLLNYLPPYFTVLYMFSMYLLSTMIFKENRRISLIVLAASIVPLFGVFQGSIYPQTLSMFFMPLLLYLYLKLRDTPNISYAISLITLMILYPFLHPIPILLLILGLPMAELTVFVLTNKNPLSLSRKDLLANISVVKVLIVFIVTFLWYNHFDILSAKIEQVRDILLPTPPPHLQKIAPVEALWSQIRLTGFELLIWYLKFYGDTLAYGLLTLIGFILLIRRRKRLKNWHRILFLISYIVAGEVIFMIQFYLVRSQSVYRLISLEALTYLMPLFVGYTLYTLITRHVKNYHKQILIGVSLIGIVASASYSTFYYSPTINLVSPQLTRFELKGTEWLLQHRATGIEWNGFAYPHTYPALLYPYSIVELTDPFSRSQYRILWYFRTLGVKEQPPDPPLRLGYDFADTAGEALTQTSWEIDVVHDPPYGLMIHDLGPYDLGLYIYVTARQFLVTSDPILKDKAMSAIHLTRYDITPEIWSKFTNDTSVHLLYSNGELQIYYIDVFGTVKEHLSSQGYIIVRGEG